MNLDERKAFRSELIIHLIRDSMEQLTLAADNYTLRVMPMDVRHHRFIAMIDLSKDLPPIRIEQRRQLTNVESCISRNAAQRFGLRLDGLYWRGGALAGAEAQFGSIRLEALSGSDGNPCHLISADEKSALMEVICDGPEGGVLHVGDWEYRTDLLPLESDGHHDAPPDKPKDPPRH